MWAVSCIKLSFWHKGYGNVSHFAPEKQLHTMFRGLLCYWYNRYCNITVPLRLLLVYLDLNRLLRFLRNLEKKRTNQLDDEFYRQ